MAYLQPLIFYILAALAIFSLISNGLLKVFRTDLHTITNLRLVPWGNAEIHCQKEHLEFIRCTEQQSLKEAPIEALWKYCSEKLRLNEEIINKCYTTGFGYKLQYSNVTAHMKPPQEYVPWVVVNNQPLRQYSSNQQLWTSTSWHFNGLHQFAALL
ncbi:gamma-interferon-responsive lysosomal thiol protein-like [Gossypium raimondii]|uniref:gamma-interferon-responsive lysosomal thiol protein-like n=1 Tax=Gossypium raimondii TaxID=29730 RepID=UPI00227BE84C|nr:gamma-interferon-responsive lysosomal thiol protein-like [Gossypium raimondii]